MAPRYARCGDRSGWCPQAGENPRRQRTVEVLGQPYGRRPGPAPRRLRHRPLDDAGPFTFVTADALTMNAREGRRVINTVVSLATGVNNDGHREVLGLRVATSETGVSEERVLRRPRRPRPEQCPAHQQRRHTGLRKAISANLPGASWQRCRTHDAANSSESSPTATRSCLSSAPSWPNKPINRPKDDATSASTSSPAHARPSSTTRPPSQDTNPYPHSPPEPTPRRNTPLHHCQRLDRRRAQGDAHERERVAAIPALSQDPLREFDRASQLSTRFADGHVIGERGTEIANVDENRRYARAAVGRPGGFAGPATSSPHARVTSHSRTSESASSQTCRSPRPSRGRAGRSLVRVIRWRARH